MTDREFILDQDNWPRWPWLPLKRLGTRDHAFLDGRDLSSHLLGQGPLPVRVGLMEPREVREYADVDAILADGWVVD